MGDYKPCTVEKWVAENIKETYSTYSNDIIVKSIC